VRRACFNEESASWAERSAAKASRSVANAGRAAAKAGRVELTVIKLEGRSGVEPGEPADGAALDVWVDTVGSDPGREF
jgi:hypothetical protein